MHSSIKWIARTDARGYYSLTFGERARTNSSASVFIPINPDTINTYYSCFSCNHCLAKSGYVLREEKPLRVLSYSFNIRSRPSYARDKSVALHCPRLVWVARTTSTLHESHVHTNTNMMYEPKLCHRVIVASPSTHPGASRLNISLLI